MKHVDDGTRRQIASERLRLLQRDQAAYAIDAVGVDNDLWEPSEESDAEGRISKRRSSAGQAKTKQAAMMKGEVLTTAGRRRGRRTIEMVLMDEPAFLPDRDTFLSVEVPSASRTPGSKPAHKLCSVCSYLSGYKCVRCGTNFCSIPCNTVHRETKCLKFAD